jgi:hypothetical protein
MSVLVKSVAWARAGGFSASLNTNQHLRFIPAGGGRISYYGGSGRYQQIVYSFPGYSQEQTLTVSEAFKILPVWGGSENYYAYRSSAGLFLNSRNISGQSYVHTIFAKTIQTDIFGWDTQVGSPTATARIVYSASEGSNSILVVKKLDFSGQPSVESGNYNAQINGDVALSQNGSFCGVYQTTSPANKIRIFERQASSLVQKGLEITLPAAVKGLKLNDAGNRFVAVTGSRFFTFDFINGAWTQISEIAISGGTSFSDGVIQMNAEGDVVIIRSDVILTFVFNSGAWVAQEAIDGTGFGELAVTKNFNEIAFNIFAGISSSFEIYRSTITETLYDEPIIEIGQSFSARLQTNFSTNLVVVEDELNRAISTWTATGLPPGLAINGVTGQITGTPTTEGEFSATITATGPGGSSTETVQFIVQSAFPIFVGAVRATAIYAGATVARAIYYGAQKLWPAPSVSLLLHMDGANGSTAFIDASGNYAVTAVGNAAISTAFSKFGGASASFDGSGDYLQISTSSNPTPFDFYGQDFTIDFWVYRISGRGLISTRKDPVYSPWSLQIGASGAIFLLIQTSSNTFSSNGFLGSTTIPANQWTHVAWVCRLNRHFVFVNGVVDQNINGHSQAILQSYSLPSNIYIGTDGDGAFQGYIDELRAVRGEAAYTANFTPPMQPY